MRTLVCLILMCACGGTNRGSNGNGDGGLGGGDGGGSNGDGSIADAGPAPDMATCGAVHVDLSPQIPTVVLVVDQSGSMTTAFTSTQDRWDALYATIMATDGPVKTLQAEVKFGLTLFCGASKNFPSCPNLTVVDPALDNYDAIDAVYAAAGPHGGTPTGDAITSAENFLKTVTAPGAKVIALATDGDPNTCAAPKTADTGPTIAAEQDAYANGIQTYVIGVGNDALQQNLQDMANAGVGLPVGGSQNAPWYQAFDETSLNNAFSTIIGGALSCKFTINGTVVAPSEGVVTFNGTTLTYGTDWQIDGTSTLEILDPTCQQILAGGNNTLDAWWPCGGVIP